MKSRQRLMLFHCNSITLFISVTTQNCLFFCSIAVQICTAYLQCRSAVHLHSRNVGNCGFIILLAESLVMQCEDDAMRVHHWELGGGGCGIEELKLSTDGLEEADHPLHRETSKW